MDDKSIDPRYDPAFQRGFSGSVKSGPRTSSNRTPAATEPPEVVDPIVPVTRAATVPASSFAPESGGFDFEVDDDDALAVPELTPLRKLLRNPFLIVLALLGAALAIAGSAWAIAGRATVTSSGSLATERDYWFVEGALYGAPILIALGIAILAGVLFVFASVYNRES